MAQVQFLHKEMISYGEGMESWSPDYPNHICPLRRSPLHDERAGHTLLLRSAQEVGGGLYPSPPHSPPTKRTSYIPYLLVPRIIHLASFLEE